MTANTLCLSRSLMLAAFVVKIVYHTAYSMSTFRQHLASPKKFSPQLCLLLLFLLLIVPFMQFWAKQADQIQCEPPHDKMVSALQTFIRPQTITKNISHIYTIWACVEYTHIEQYLSVNTLLQFFQF